MSRAKGQGKVKAKAVDGAMRIKTPVPVTVVAYEFDDAAIDKLIDVSFRIFERMASRPDVIARVAQLVLLLNSLQR